MSSQEKSPTMFKAIVATADGRITKGANYQGIFVYIVNPRRPEYPVGWRIQVKDNLGVNMTFKPEIFMPLHLMEVLT